MGMARVPINGVRPCKGPMTCDFPDVEQFRRGSRWECPHCGALYRMSRRIRREMPWRNWTAPHGRWHLLRA